MPYAHPEFGRLIERIAAARGADRPVIVMMGAHLIKNGLGPLVVDLLNRNMITLVAGNAATAIHDFELALTGQTSEDVPGALDKGLFGMAYEFAYINHALSVGNQQQLGYGETLGKMICDENFQNEIFTAVAKKDSPRGFANPEISILATCYKNSIPFTVHAGIGTDVIDQHRSFNGCDKGGCSGRDFLIFAQHVTELTEGGVILNVGCAITGPEVLLKTVSMAANIGKAPDKIITADFDLRDYQPKQLTDESAQGYYLRDQKSIVTRIPQAFNGKGFYIQGNQKQTIPALYKNIIENTET